MSTLYGREGGGQGGPRQVGARSRGGGAFLRLCGTPVPFQQRLVAPRALEDRRAASPVQPVEFLLSLCSPPPPPRALRNGLLRARGPGALELISVLGRRSWREGACLGALQLSERAAVRRRAAKQRTEEPALRRKGTRRVQLVRRDGRDVSTRSPRNRYLSSEWLHASWASRGVPLWSRKSLRGSAAG